MTTSQETIRDTARRDGEAFSHAMRRWIDDYYYFLEEMLILQRDFVKTFWPTRLPAPKTATEKQ